MNIFKIYTINVYVICGIEVYKYLCVCNRIHWSARPEFNLWSSHTKD